MRIVLPHGTQHLPRPVAQVCIGQLIDIRRCLLIAVMNSLGKDNVFGTLTCAISPGPLHQLIVGQTIGGAGVPGFAIGDDARRAPAITLPLDRFDAAELAAHAGHIQISFNEFNLLIHCLHTHDA